MQRIVGSAMLFVLAAVMAAANAGDKETGFVNKVYKNKDGEFKYVVFVPKEYTGEKEFPVILFLHGAGESGSDGQKQVKVGLGKAIRDKKEQFPFIAVFPQSTGGWGAGGAPGKRAIAILDEVEKTYKTDKKRVYLTGLSMGGFGTWSMAVAHPERWAAIAPICGGGDPKQAAKIKDIPCWCFHGDADTAVNVQKSRDMIKALKDAGGNPKYDEYPKVGHNSWDRAYATAELYEWFLKQSKEPAKAPPQSQDKQKPIRALLVIGGCCHDYAKQKELLTKGISERALVEWTISYDPDKGTKHLNPIYEKPDWSSGFDVVVHDECCSDVTDEAVISRILEPHRAGLPAVVLHCGMHSYRSKGFPKATPWFEFTGLPSTGHGPQQPIAISFSDRESPITKGLADWTTINEELYNNSAGKLLDTAKPLARGKQGKSDFVVAWTNTYNGKTRVFATTLGHNNDTVADARYLDLVTRGLLWSVDKLGAPYLKSAK